MVTKIVLVRNSPRIRITDIHKKNREKNIVNTIGVSELKNISFRMIENIPTENIPIEDRSGMRAHLVNFVWIILIAYNVWRAAAVAEKNDWVIDNFASRTAMLPRTKILKLSN